MRTPVTHENAMSKVPLATGLFDFFPDALAYVAKVSKEGNVHHYGAAATLKIYIDTAADPDALLRHFMMRGSVDPSDKMRHTGKMVWRALALLQQELEQLMITHDKQSVVDLTPEELQLDSLE